MSRLDFFPRVVMCLCVCVCVPLSLPHRARRVSYTHERALGQSVLMHAWARVHVCMCVSADVCVAHSLATVIFFFPSTLFLSVS